MSEQFHIFGERVSAAYQRMQDRALEDLSPAEIQARIDALST
jgi:hypothetical protein